MTKTMTYLVVELEDKALGLLGVESLDSSPQSVAIEATPSSTIVRKMRNRHDVKQLAWRAHLPCLGGKQLNFNVLE
jgi:hypothetical protein